jgi:outer membrane protein assembly factor BamB
MARTGPGGSSGDASLNNRSTGAATEKFKVADPCRAPIAADEMIYIGSFGNLYAIDAKTGIQKWFLKTRQA